MRWNPDLSAQKRPVRGHVAVPIIDAHPHWDLPIGHGLAKIEPCLLFVGSGRNNALQRLSERLPVAQIGHAVPP